MGAGGSRQSLRWAHGGSLGTVAAPSSVCSPGVPLPREALGQVSNARLPRPRPGPNAGAGGGVSAVSPSLSPDAPGRRGAGQLSWGALVAGNSPPLKSTPRCLEGRCLPLPLYLAAPGLACSPPPTGRRSQLSWRILPNCPHACPVLPQAKVLDAISTARAALPFTSRLPPGCHLHGSGPPLTVTLTAWVLDPLRG